MMIAHSHLFTAGPVMSLSVKLCLLKKRERERNFSDKDWEQQTSMSIHIKTLKEI